MIVTDFKWKDYKTGDPKTGYYMDKWLVQNLMGVPGYLKKAWDCVGIVSGHGKVRIGKSTLAMQVGYFLAWQMAGGEMILDEKGKVIDMIRPKKEVKFSLEENVVFTPQDLIKTADLLHTKYGKNQIIIYDEARAGLASDRTMENVNKTMSEWFEKCGMFGHIILLVLPNFFKLHEDYAVSRSLFLIDVFADKKQTRGFFNFYNEKQKEYLYYFGKKRVGVTARYSATNESFWGRFSSFIPVDKEEYDKLKKKAISEKPIGKNVVKWTSQRDVFIYLLKELTSLKIPQIEKYANKILHERFQMEHDVIAQSVFRIKSYVKNRGIDIDA